MGKFWGYLKTLFRAKAEAKMDPSIQIEQALESAEKEHQKLRNNAREIIANQKFLALQMERTGKKVADAQANARVALMEADKARKTGNTSDAEEFEKAAQTLGTQWEMQEQVLESQREMYRTADKAANDAKAAVESNEARMMQLHAQAEGLKQLNSQRKMQDQLNKTLNAPGRNPVDMAPTLDQIEEKIQKQLSVAKAGAELNDLGPAGAMRKIEDSRVTQQADLKLDKLREELGLELSTGEKQGVLGTGKDETVEEEAEPKEA